MSHQAGDIAGLYKEHTAKKRTYIMVGFVLLLVVSVLSISTGSVDIPPQDVIRTLAGDTVSTTWDSIIWNVRLPQVLTALVVVQAWQLLEL